MNAATFQRAKKYLFVIALFAGSCVISGCIQSIWNLTSDSRLPEWITLPPGLPRADVLVQEEAMEPTRRGVDIKVILYDKKWRKLEVVRGKSFDLSGRYFAEVVNDRAEVIGLTHHPNEHGVDWPYFFVVDDPALKRKLLNENEAKLKQDYGMDYPALRKNLLGENGVYKYCPR